MYQKVCILMMILLSVTIIFSATPEPAFVKFLGSVFSPRSFTDGKISDDDIQQILYAGSHAASGMNAQPWHFTVVQNRSLIDKMMDNVNGGNILIVISGPARDKSRFSEFDCGLATQNMFLATKALGYNARIYASPVQKVNEEMRETLSIPNEYNAIMVLRVGHSAENTDATTSASPRASVSEKSNIVK